MAKSLYCGVSCKLFKARVAPQSNQNAGELVPHFAWDPQAECGYLREDFCELPVCVLAVRRGTKFLTLVPAQRTKPIKLVDCDPVRIRINI
jgi:hypothetical protein